MKLKLAVMEIGLKIALSSATEDEKRQLLENIEECSHLADVADREIQYLQKYYKKKKKK
jgi:hypothetical protein